MRFGQQMTGPELVGLRVQAPDTSPLLNCLIQRPPTKGQVDEACGAIAVAELSSGAYPNSSRRLSGKWPFRYREFAVRVLGPIPEQWPLP